MKRDSLIIAWGYFIIHALVEIVCFDVLFTHFYQGGVIWVIALLFDFFAFVPQGIIGDFYNKHKNLDLGLIGVALMMGGVVVLQLQSIAGLILLAIGNSCVHEAGAYATVYSADGHLANSGYFVAGGSFGVVIGQFIGKVLKTGLLFRLLVLVVMAILIVYTSRLREKGKLLAVDYDIVNRDKSLDFILLVSFIVVVSRSFIGYCIPISWKKSIWQSFLLFFVMGLGKAMGGYLADKYGAKKVAVASSLFSIPFLVFGKNVMVVSIVGVFMFSLTMAITFGMFLSVIKDNVGLAFGFTTLGLFVGTLPVFIFGQFSNTINVIIVIILSLVSAYGLNLTLK